MSSNRSHPILPMTTVPSPLEQWTKQFQEAERLIEEVVKRVAERESVPESLRVELQHRTAEIRRMVAILQTKMSLMQEELSQVPTLKQATHKLEGDAQAGGEVRCSGAQGEAGGCAVHHEELLKQQERTAWTERQQARQVVDVSSLVNMVDREIIQLQRNVIQQQDECLDSLEETVVSTKHIALAINEEIDLHTRLIDDLDERVEDASYQLQRAQKMLKSVNTRMGKSSSCTSIVLSVIAAVILVVVLCALIVF